MSGIWTLPKDPTLFYWELSFAYPSLLSAASATGSGICHVSAAIPLRVPLTVTAP